MERQNVYLSGCDGGCIDDLFIRCVCVCVCVCVCGGGGGGGGGGGEVSLDLGVMLVNKSLL